MPQRALADEGGPASGWPSKLPSGAHYVDASSLLVRRFSNSLPRFGAIRSPEPRAQDRGLGALSDKSSHFEMGVTHPGGHPPRVADAAIQNGNCISKWAARISKWVCHFEMGFHSWMNLIFLDEFDIPGWVRLGETFWETFRETWHLTFAGLRSACHAVEEQPVGCQKVSPRRTHPGMKTHSGMQNPSRNAKHIQE